MQEIFDLATDDEGFEKLNMEMFQKFVDRNPLRATLFGLHDPYDWLLPDGSSKNVFGNLELMKEWTGRMKRTVGYSKLSVSKKIDWKIIEFAYERAKFDVYQDRSWETNPDAFFELAEVILVMLTREYAPIEKRVEAIVSRLEKLPKYLAEFRTRFDKSRPVKLWTRMAIENCQQIEVLSQFILSATEETISDDLRNRLIGTIEALQLPAKQHLEWLGGLLSKTKDDWALGREKLEKLLEIRGLGMTSEEIYKLGLRYLEEFKKERSRLAENIAPGKSTEEVMAQIEADAPRTFEEALKFTKGIMEKSREFVIEKGIATVCPDDKLHVEETPEFMRPLLPFAALSPPGRFDRRQEGIYVVTRPMDMKNLGKHMNYANIAVIAVHEGFPGHFLQGAVTNRGSFVHLFANGIETAEGWAHYCEDMMTEHGFIKGYQSQFMKVNNAIWRAGRIIVDVKLSTGEMSFDEAVDLLMKETGMSREGAEAEVLRYTMFPTYALSYLLGKHLILKLRDEIKNKMGERYSEKFFHDTITANGQLPFVLLKEVFDLKLKELGVT